MTRDRDLLRPLVGAHLRMSFRGRASQAFAGQLAGRPVGVAWLFVMYLAIGAATLPVLAGGADVFTYALVTQLLTWTMCGLSLTAEAGDALVGTGEADVLGHRPVAPEILLVAKVAVLFAFSCSLALAQNLIPALALAIRDSWRAAIGHAAVVALSVGVLTAVVTVIYGIAARLVPRDRFDDVAGWSQIGLAIVFVSLGIVTPHSVLTKGGVHVDPTARMLLALPPAWFAGLESWLADGTADVRHLAAAAATVVVGIALLARGPIAVRLADALLHVQDERGGRHVRPLPDATRGALGLWLRDPVERACFRLATAYLRRDRDVRLRLRPSLVVFALMPLAGLVLEESRGGHLAPLASVCLLGMVPGVALEALRISSHPVASEIFAVVPIAGTASVFQGVRKAAIYSVLPAMIVAVLLAVVVVPGGVVLAVPGVLAFPVLTLIPGLFGPYVPLARPKGRGQQAVANAVLLAASTGLLGVLVQATLAASRHGRIPELYAGELVVLLGIDRTLRLVIARRGLTSPGTPST